MWAGVSFLGGGIEAGIAGAMLAMAGVLLVVGWRIAAIRMDIPYTGWEVPTGYAYLAVPVAAGLIGMMSLGNLWGGVCVPGPCDGGHHPEGEPSGSSRSAW